MKEFTVEKSQALFEYAKNIIPGGAQHSRRPKNFMSNFPVYMTKSQGAHIWDVDGNEYIDYLLSFGPMVLGHRCKDVDQAVIDVINNGFLFDMIHPMYLELCKKLIEIFPGAEKVLLMSTGSGSTSAAVRMARIYTGRQKIIRWGYHGWHDWCCPNRTGIPQSTTDDVLTFSYNNLASLERVLEKNKGKVACIIMMPYSIEQPEPGFLQGVRDLADQHNVVLIFDEVRSWPRTDLGGAQKYFGVVPDLTTISKGLANGYPISAVLGKDDVMMASEKTTISATFFPSLIGIAAALATIKVLENTNAIQHMWEMGKILKDGLSEIILNKKIEASVVGLPPMPYLLFGNEDCLKKVWMTESFAGGDPGTLRD